MRFVTRAVPFAALVMALMVAPGCGLTTLERVQGTGAALRAHPGSLEAAAYAEALHDAIAGHAYADQSAEFRRRAEEALAALTANEATAGPDKPKLAAWRGRLLLDLGRNDEGWTELRRSMAMRPTLVAARLIVPLQHQQGHHDDVVQTCVQTAAAVTDRNELFDLIQLCAANMDARDEAGSLAWATPELRAFFDADRARRKREAEEAAAAQAAADADFQAAAAANQQAMDDAMRAAQMANQAAIDAATHNTLMIPQGPPP